MNILMCTNSYYPLIGGVSRSIKTYVQEFRDMGHRVMIVAPYYKDISEKEIDIVRVRALTSFRGSDFSVPLPVPRMMKHALRTFRPDIIHSHHPYLIGFTALRLAAWHDVPIVFTHHTLYEHYLHYILCDPYIMRQAVIRFVSAYCNLCDAIVVPSASVSRLLLRRAVTVPIEVIPTGVSVHSGGKGDRRSFRQQIGIPEDSFVIGYVGRLAREKNLSFLAHTVACFLKKNNHAHFLVSGRGPEEKTIQRIIEAHQLSDRLHILGGMDHKDLSCAYQSMDVFAFASRTETQALVLIEAMASGIPVVALDGTGVRDVVKDRQNGRLISRCDLHEFARGLAWVASLSSDKYQSLRQEAMKTARDFSATSSAERMLSLYESIIRLKRSRRTSKSRAMRLLHTERRVFSSILRILLRSVCLVDVAPKKLAYLPVQDQTSHFSAISRPGFAPRILGLYYACAMRLRLASLHIEAEGLEELDKKIESGAPILVIFWHGKYVPLFALFAGRRACIFSSRSFRGEVISEICRHFGYVCILIPEHLRESALNIMSQALAHYRVGATAADGPSGPPRRIKPGLLKLASKLGHSVIPVSVASLPKRIKKHRWDRMEYPCFRSHVYLVVGDEIIIPPDLKQSEYDEWMHRLKEILDDTDRQAEERVMVCLSTDPITFIQGLRNDPETVIP